MRRDARREDKKTERKRGKGKTVILTAAVMLIVLR